MWASVERDLGELLSSKVFPSLRGISAYEKLLKPNGQPDPIACKTAARNIVNATDVQSGIRELGSRENPRVIEWKDPLYRAVSAKNNPNGYWWFDQGLLDRWERNYPPGTPKRSELILESIRPMIGVCFDWNDFTDLRVLRPSGPIPVITGQGTHKPVVSPADKRHGEVHNVFFIAGYRQVFVPFVNPMQTAAFRF